ncbi:MAG TPA: malonate transporter, partial [Eubacteriaceae bacterium]|nr:malonate transporter [Eubacteriaceae bacterium]
MVFIDSINQEFILSMLIIVLGYVLKRVGFLKEEDRETLSRLVFNVTLPAIVFRSMSVSIDLSVIFLVVLGLVFGLFMTFVAWYITRNKSRMEKGMYAIAVPGSNIGLFAYPLVEAIWGLSGMVYIVLFDLGSVFIVFGTCYFFAKYYSEDSIDF